ncbi:MAG: SDR family oxidoreductase [Bacteroidota bacterium]|nr:SDR family oxidoreductase [Bacteroidota bacterium]
MRHIKEKQEYTLITGASSGIGKALATECAGRGMNLILVALPGDDLEDLAWELEARYEVRTVTFGIDLTAPASAESIYEFCRSSGYKVNMLINNAGRGFAGTFDASSPSLNDSLILLNIHSLVMLTQYFITDLKQQDNAYILNLGSMASFHPVPYKSVYAASKSFVFSFSRSLREELKRTNVKVSVLCPGPVVTSAEVQARIDKQGLLAKIPLMMPDAVAAIAIRKLLAGKPVIIPGFFNKFYMVLIKFIPRMVHQFVLERALRRNVGRGISHEISTIVQHEPVVVDTDSRVRVN